MARERLCKVCGGWHDLDMPWPDNCWPERTMMRSDLAAPMIIQDNMQPVKSMLDGKMYDSKSQLRATYRAAGVVEVGNDVPTKPKAPTRPKRAEIKAAVGKAFSQAGLGA
tara:strand:+ start:1521 stop:1850 length:330 start_codon:yes stop_codon:yes gene_type:complete